MRFVQASSFLDSPIFGETKLPIFLPWFRSHYLLQLFRRTWLVSRTPLLRGEYKTLDLFWSSDIMKKQTSTFLHFLKHKKLYSKQCSSIYFHQKSTTIDMALILITKEENPSGLLKRQVQKGLLPYFPFLELVFFSINLVCCVVAGLSMWISR